MVDGCASKDATIGYWDIWREWERDHFAAHGLPYRPARVPRSLRGVIS